jgi:hypothetical protein
MNKNNPDENFFYGTIFSYGVLLTIWFLAYMRMVYSKSNDSFLYKAGILIIFVLCFSFRIWLDFRYKCEINDTRQSFILYLKSLASSVFLLSPMGIVQKLTTMDGFLAPFANTIGYLAIRSKIKQPLRRLIQSYKNTKSSLTQEENIYFETMTNNLDILINLLSPSNLNSDTSILDKLNLLSSTDHADDLNTVKTMTNIRFLISEALWFIFSAIITFTNVKLFVKSYSC